MTESSRLTKILLDILDRVKHRGSSTKVNWMNFSNGQPMSRSKFDSIIGNFGLPLHDGDLDIIWANIEIKGQAMGYSDFVRFITMDKIDASKGGSGSRSGRGMAPPQPTYPDEPPMDNYDNYGTPGGGYGSNRPPSNPSSSRQMPPSGRSSGGAGLGGNSGGLGGNPGGYASNRPPSAGGSGPSLSRILMDSKAQIGNAMLMTDPTFTGFITVQEFEDIIQRIALVNSSEIQRLVGIYDTTNSGYFNYFMLLGDICNQTNELPPRISGGGGRAGSGGRASGGAGGYNDVGFADDYGAPPRGGGGAYNDGYGAPPPRGGYDDYGASPQRGGYDDYAAPRGGGGMGPSGGYDDYGAQPPRGGSGMAGGAGYDDYGAPPPRNPGLNNSGGYDDYGAPPPRNGPPPSYDDYGAGSSPGMGGGAGQSMGASKSRCDEIIELIAARMDNVYDSSQTCYQKWRGYSRALGPQELASGARRDFKIDITPDEAAAVIDRYSTKGNLSLGEFLKLVGAGSDIISEQRKAAKAVELSEEEKTLLHVARQAKMKGKDWRAVFDQCDSPDRVVQSLRTLNIYVMLNDLRPCYNKFGKDGVIQKIQDFMSQV